MSTEPATIVEAAGIDVGFFGSKACWGRLKDDTQYRVNWCPSELTHPRNVKDASREAGYEVVINGAPFWGGPGVGNFLKASGARSFKEGWALDDSHKALFEIKLASVAFDLSTTKFKIKNLVGGLPMSNFYKDRYALQAVYGGTHVLPGAAYDRSDLTVTIENVRIVPQPAGSLFFFARGALPAVSSETVLVVDVGGGTFDWAVYESLKQQAGRCGSAPIGTLKLAREICESVVEGAGSEPKLLERVDRALHKAVQSPSAQTVMIYGQEVALAPHLDVIRRLQTEAINLMFESIEKVGDVSYIIATGGGAEFMVPRLKAARQMEKWKGRIHMDQDPVYTNVKGFFVIADMMARGEV